MENIYFSVLFVDDSNKFVKSGLIKDIFITDYKSLEHISFIKISKSIVKNEHVNILPYILIYNKNSINFKIKNAYNIEKNLQHVFVCSNEKSMYLLFKKICEIVQEPIHEIPLIMSYEPINLKVKK